MREYQVRICQGLGVKFPGPTRQRRDFLALSEKTALGSRSCLGAHGIARKLALPAIDPVQPNAHYAAYGLNWSECMHRQRQAASPVLTEWPDLGLERPGRGGLQASHSAVAAMSSGFRKKLSGLSGMFRRVLGRSTTASTTVKATWMPCGQRLRAIDSARLRCAALAGANAAVLGPPRVFSYRPPMRANLNRYFSKATLGTSKPTQEAESRPSRRGGTRLLLEVLLKCFGNTRTGPRDTSISTPGHHAASSLEISRAPWPALSG